MIQGNEFNKIIIYGAGQAGKEVYDIYGDAEVYAFCESDSSKAGSYYCGKKIISIVELLNERLYTIIAIKDPCIAAGIKTMLEQKGITCNTYNEMLDEVQLRLEEMTAHRPLDMNIETINSCPMKCVFCVNRKNTRIQNIMDNIKFETIVAQYAELWGGTLGIGSMQSDFLSDPILLKRIDVIRRLKHKLWVHSTTPLISAEKYSDEEFAEILSVFDYLEISAGGYDRESYNRMMGVDAFDIFSRQLDRLRRLIDEYKLELDIDIAFRTYDTEKCRGSDFYNKISRVFRISEVKTSFFSWFGSIDDTELPKGANLLKSYNSGRESNCVVPNATLAIQSDGRAVGCGCIDWLSSYVIGDTSKQTLDEIWNSNKAREFRNAFTNGILPKICSECALYTPVSVLRNIKLRDYTSMDGLYYFVKAR
ncbi:MAG: SPASM domain-containing protein [Lachnospiraceae bacterium]|nr:SPASM domain-containing protein [Lachnospiraceae bacterium]